MEIETLVRRIPAPVDSGRVAALLPASEADDAAILKIPLGETFSVQIIRGRSLQHHRLFFALLDHVAKASKFETTERLLVALKVRLGRYDLLAMPNGKVVPVPQSISFAAMDQTEFEKFFNDGVRVICEEVLPGTNRDDLIMQVEAMLGSP